MNFTEFSLHEDILKGLEQAGFSQATRVQQLTLQAVVAEGKDVTVQSQTGTGKTAAFLLPVFQVLLTDEKAKGQKVLVLAPTRELAVQIEEEARLLGAFLPFRYGAVYGGVGYGQQEEMLKQGVDFLIATPGRLMDFMSSRKIDCHEFGVVVIDEADRLLDMGFYPDIKRILGKCAPREQRRTLLLSATMSTRVSNIAWEHMNDPVGIAIEPEQVTVDLIEQRLYHLSREEKLPFLLGYLNQTPHRNALIFTNTKRMAEELAKRLEINGYPACFLMGDLAQKKRLAVINDMKQGKIKYLVATDVAARGLHIDALDLVVNYDLPEDPENYVHRIGRTARAGKTGQAISLSCDKYVFSLEGIEKFIGMKIPQGEFNDQSFAVDASRGMRIQLSTWEDDPHRPSGSRGSRPPRPQGQGRRDQGPRQQGPIEGRPVRSGGRPPVERREAGHDRNRQQSPGQQRQEKGLPPVRTMEQRLAHYRQKFGESFEPTPELLQRLAREEQRSKEQRQRALARGEHGGREEQKPARSGRNATPGAAQRPRQTGQNARNQASQGPTSLVQTTHKPATPVAPAREQKKEHQDKGIVAWIKGLFRGKKQA